MKRKNVHKSVKPKTKHEFIYISTRQVCRHIAQNINGSADAERHDKFHYLRITPSNLGFFFLYKINNELTGITSMYIENNILPLIIHIMRRPRI